MNRKSSLFFITLILLMLLSGCGSGKITSDLSTEEISTEKGNIDYLCKVYSAIELTEESKTTENIKRDLSFLAKITNDKDALSLVSQDDIENGVDVVYSLYDSKTKFLEKTKLKVEDVWRYAKFKLYLQRHWDRVTASVSVSDDEVLQYYNNNISLYQVDETVTLQHILVSSEDEAVIVLSQLSPDGLNFEEFANANTEDKSSVNIVNTSKGRLLEPIEDVIYSNENLGLYTKPIQSELGWHIINIVSRTEGKSEPLDRVAPVIKDQLLKEKQTQTYDDYMKRLEGN